MSFSPLQCSIRCLLLTLPSSSKRCHPLTQHAPLCHPHTDLPLQIPKLLPNPIITTELHQSVHLKNATLRRIDLSQNILQVTKPSYFSPSLNRAPLYIVPCDLGRNPLTTTGSYPHISILPQWLKPLLSWYHPSCVTHNIAWILTPLRRSQALLAKSHWQGAIVGPCRQNLGRSDNFVTKARVPKLSLM